MQKQRQSERQATRPERPLHGARALHAHIAQRLRHDIGSGVYPPGDRIPSLSALVRDMRASTTTVRRAIHELTKEGLLRGHAGLGVFVRDRKVIERSPEAKSIVEDMRKAGVKPRFERLFHALMPCEAEAARKLGLRPGALAYYTRQRVFGDEEPISVNTNWSRREIGEVIAQTKDDVLVPVMSKRAKLRRRDLRIAGGAASEEEARLLDVPVGFASLVVDYVWISAAGVPVITGRIVARADRIAYRFSVPA